jgi:hypothetical protein
MKRLLILTAVVMLLGSSMGCRFWNCLWRGPAQQQQQAAVVCPSPCMTSSSCSPCDSGATVTTVTPSPVTYQPTQAQP